MTAAAPDLGLDDDFEDDDSSPPPPSAWRRLHAFGWVRVFLALPAVVALLAAVGVAMAPRGNVEARYRTLVLDAFAAQQFSRAEIGSLRLLQLAPFSPEHRFWLALARDGLGDRAGAEALIASLAPNDRAGYGPAHFWQAERLLRSEPLTATAVRDAERHLRRVDRDQLKSEVFQRHMALVLLKTNRLDEAKEHLGGADLQSNPDLRLAYAEALLQHGRKEDGNRELTKAINDLRERVNRQGKSASDDGTARRALADALAMRGDFPGAEFVLQEGLAIGPAERYARPAAQFYAKWLAASDGTGASPPSPQAVAGAIELLVKHYDGSLLSSGLLSYLYQRAGRIDEAIVLLERVSKTQPDAGFDLVRLYSQTARPEKAREAASAASTLLSSLVEKNPTDAGLRERLIEAFLLTGRYEKAVAAAEDGRKRGQKAFNLLLARAYVSWWDAVTAKQAATNGPPLNLLRRAIDADPWNTLVFTRLSAIQGPEAKAAREMVMELLAKGEAPPAAIHWILGNEAWSRGEKALARTHLEQAYALAATNPLVLNNLSWMLAFSDPVDLPRALRLADEAVRQAPKAVELRDTRGRIYAKAGEWPKALADLQLCLPVKKSDAEFLRVLADAAANTGLPELADQYRRMLKERDAVRPVNGRR